MTHDHDHDRGEQHEGWREGRERGEDRRRNRGFHDGPHVPPIPPIPPFPPLPNLTGPGGIFGPDGVFGPGGIFGGPPPPRRGRGRGGRAGRGDVRVAILLLLDEGPANGYQIMQEIEQRTNGTWKPSSGSVYPALQQLEDEGLVIATEAEGRRMFALTEDGRAHVTERRATLTAPWDNMAEEAEPSEEAVRVKDVIAQLGMAYTQVLQVGDEDQRAAAAKILVKARQDLYRILAGDSLNED